jgi:hypothetical protein
MPFGKTKMKIPSAICLLILSTLPVLDGAETQKQTVLVKVAKMIKELASTDGFSDEDATKVAVFFLEKLAGPKPADQKLFTRIDETKPESVTVFVSYDFGIGFTGFQFQFERGDPGKGLRFAHFVSLKLVPSE